MLETNAGNPVRDGTASKLVVLASGSGSNLQAILDACQGGVLPARVAAVVSDQWGAYALERAALANVPALTLPWAPYKQSGQSRSEYDAHLAGLAASYQPDWIILAGWMRLLSCAFLDRFPSRVVNLHPALPGAFPGTHAIERAFEAYQQGLLHSTGVMVHLVPDEGVDSGPVIAQQSVPIFKSDTLESLTARIHEVEHRLLVSAIRSLIVPAPASPEISR